MLFVVIGGIVYMQKIMSTEFSGNVFITKLSF